MSTLDIKNPEFVGSFPKLSLCPDDKKPEYAFIGRSNVGKSSLINMLTARKNLAKTSSTPGKTQSLNFFLIDKAWYLVDLPGYGFAKTSKKNRETWGKLIQEYLIKRKSLICTFLLVDSRHEPQKSDLDFINWMGSVGLPFCLVFTKSDKLTKNKLVKNLDQYKSDLSEYWSELPMIFVTSSETSIGKDAILEFIRANNKELGVAE